MTGFTPTFNEFKRLGRKGNLIALSQTIPADLETPVSAFLKLAANAPHAFLLESAVQGERIGRYSFLGLKPKAILTLQGGRLEISPKSFRPFLKPADLLGSIKRLLSQYKPANAAQFASAFCGGFVGYLSYENVSQFENIPLRAKPGAGLPEGIFFLTEELLVFDHFRKTLSIIVLVETSSADLKKLYKKAAATAVGLTQKLRRPLHFIASPKHPTKRAVPQFNMPAALFKKRVGRIKEYIRAGDCIQVVFSQRATLPAVKDDFQIYRALRSINPSPYMFYFRAGKYRLIGSSPEVLVKKAGSRAEIRPIAGTRPRGRTPQEDTAHEEHLRKSKKEMAEHLMLVDLGRNDLGRVCQFNSIRIQNFARVERYSHVMHLVSDIVGKLKNGKDAFDLLRSSFPAGTVSGAPKVRAMQIIDELEPQQRGPYAGCLGYFSFNQDMDMCITIRTLFTDGRHIYVQAGAGIVKDSSPEREYQETVNKAKALLKAIETHGEFDAARYR